MLARLAYTKHGSRFFVLFLALDYNYPMAGGISIDAIGENKLRGREKGRERERKNKRENNSKKKVTGEIYAELGGKRTKRSDVR